MDNKNLKLNATSDEDLRVISAHLQDSITQVKNIAHLKKNRIFSKIGVCYACPGEDPDAVRASA